MSRPGDDRGLESPFRDGEQALSIDQLLGALVLFAVIGGLSEFLGGLGLAAGLLTPLAAAALIGVMINAMTTVTGANGLWETSGGVEYSVCIAVVALSIATIGPRRLALDRFFRWDAGGWTEGAVALGLGGIAAAVVLSL